MAPSEHATGHPHAHELRQPDGAWKYTNRLADETSPYLLQHAHNPVDWYPWGPEAFAAARRQDKPIFLSIGYSTCYWCHVMERQVFENPAIAEQMNEHFINVKVDREEQPDVDELYMTATQMMTGRGGWPMSVFLTPPRAGGDEDAGLKPFWAGTYIPPAPAHGLPSFPQVLEGLSRAWREQRQGVLEQAERVAAAVRQHLAHRDTSGPLGAELVERAAHDLLRTYDAQHGGFGDAPKFPQPVNLAFLLAVQRHTGDDDIRHALAHTLDRMARGGMYDQVGGGFHRYSVDAEWLVPHFEKMLYDNGQLVSVYAEALALDPDGPQAGFYRRVIQETCDYVLREMVDATGAFWSAQDAEVETREGGNYVWTRQQIEQVIDDAELAALAVRMYGLDRGPNFRDPHHPESEPVNVLYLPRLLSQLAEEQGLSLEALLERRRRINARLKEVRDARPQPATDDKVLAGWNGLMIAGLARAGRVLDRPDYTDAAARAADAILQHMSTDAGGLLRTMRAGEAKIDAFLEDYTFFAHGLIELHRANGEARYLDHARRLTDAAIERFATEGGGYFDTLADQTDLFVRVRSNYDGALPSGNSQMAHNLIDLHELTGDPDPLDRAVGDLRSFGQALDKQRLGLLHMEHALLRAIERAPQRFGAPAEPAPQTPEAPVAVTLEPARLVLTDGETRATVRLHIAEGYHLNAGDPGDPDLIPTRLELRRGEGLSLEVAYPDGQSRQYPYTDEPVWIYEGQVELRVQVRRHDQTKLPTAPRLVLRFQACTDTECLPPQTIELPLQITPGDEPAR